jgi:5-methylcytosine-specific restriction endonuclease McrA
MARIRTIKPEFWQDEKLAPLSPITRLVFLGLISQADDAGRLVDSPRLLNGLLFSQTEDDCVESLGELNDIGVIDRGLTASGQGVIQIVGWEKHQRIEKPNMAAALPIPIASTTRRRKIPERLREAIIARDEGLCQECGVEVQVGKRDRYDNHPTLAEIDHIVAVADGGTNDPQNLRLTCLACNRKKAGEAVRRRNADASATNPGKIDDASPPRSTTNDLRPTNNDLGAGGSGGADPATTSDIGEWLGEYAPVLVGFRARPGNVALEERGLFGMFVNGPTAEGQWKTADGSRVPTADRPTLFAQAMAEFVASGKRYTPSTLSGFLRSTIRRWKEADASDPITEEHRRTMEAADRIEAKFLASQARSIAAEEAA